MKLEHYITPKDKANKDDLLNCNDAYTLAEKTHCWTDGVDFRVGYLAGQRDLKKLIYTLLMSNEGMELVGGSKSSEADWHRLFTKANKVREMLDKLTLKDPTQ